MALSGGIVEDANNPGGFWCGLTRRDREQCGKRSCSRMGVVRKVGYSEEGIYHHRSSLASTTGDGEVKDTQHHPGRSPLNKSSLGSKDVPALRSRTICLITARHLSSGDVVSIEESRS